MTTISILAVHGGLQSSITSICDAFFIADLWQKKITGSTEPLFNTRILTIDGNPVRACGGTPVHPDSSIDDVEDSDYVIISPMMPHLSEMPKDLGRLHSWLTDLIHRGATAATVCTGTFILAEMGLLNGRRATTNWQFANMFRRTYPQVMLEPRQMMIRDGSFITTGAVTAVYNLIMHMVRTLGSPALASLLSKAMLIDPSRSDQSPYTLFHPEKTHGDQQILKAQAYIENEYAAITGIEDVAREAGISPRHFIRRFKAATGEVPLKYLQQVRIEKAKERLELTRETVEEITWAVGYRDLSSFGRLFKQYTKLSPKAYRDRFSMSYPG